MPYKYLGNDFVYLLFPFEVTQKGFILFDDFISFPSSMVFLSFESTISFVLSEFMTMPKSILYSFHGS